MFKDVSIFIFLKPLELSIQQICEALAEHQYKEIGATQTHTAGFVSPLPEGLDERPLVYPVMGRLLIKIKEARRNVKPAELVKRLADQIEGIEKGHARKVGKKERQVLKDELTLELLPHTFPEIKTTMLYIHPAAGLLVVDAKSDKHAEFVVSCLRSALGSLPIQRPSMQHSPVLRMTHWLKDPAALPVIAPDASADCYQGFTVGCKATMDNDEGGVIKISGEDPSSEVNQSYLDGGYRCHSLQVKYWENGDEGAVLEINAELNLFAIKPSDFVKDEIDRGRAGGSEESNELAMHSLNVDSIILSNLIEHIWSLVVAGFGGYEKAPATWVQGVADLSCLAGWSISHVSEKVVIDSVIENQE